MVLNAHFHKWHFWSRKVSVYFNLEWGRSSSRPRPHLVLKSSLSRPHPVLVLSSSPKFEIYLVLVPSRPEDVLGPSQDDSFRPTDPWSDPLYEQEKLTASANRTKSWQNSWRYHELIGLRIAEIQNDSSNSPSELHITQSVFCLFILLFNLCYILVVWFVLYDFW